MHSDTSQAAEERRVRAEGRQTANDAGRQAQNYHREDTRWEQATPARDWLILLAVIVLHTAWMLAVFFLEPGIR